MPRELQLASKPPKLAYVYISFTGETKLIAIWFVRVVKSYGVNMA